VGLFEFVRWADLRLTGGSPGPGAAIFRPSLSEKLELFGVVYITFDQVQHNFSLGACVQVYDTGLVARTPVAFISII
jgi:hypothetical protein